MTGLNNRKKIIATFLLIVILVAIITIPMITYAAEQNILFSQEEQDQLNKEARKNRMETQTGSLINSVSGFIIDFLHLKDLVTLIYMRPVNHSSDENIDTWIDKHNRDSFMDGLYEVITERYQQLMNENPVFTDGKTNKYSYYDFLFPFDISYEHSTYRVLEQMAGTIGGENGLLFCVKSIDTTEFPVSLVFGLLPRPVMNIVSSVGEAFRIIAVYLLIGIIAVTGLMMMIKSSSRSIQYFKEVSFGIMLALVVLMFAAALIKILGDLNRLGVNLAYAMLDPDERGTSFINMLYNKNTASLGMAIVSIIAVFMIATMNFQYMVRLISLTVLSAMSPVVAVVGIFPSKKDALSIWLNELISNVFMQTCHAFALTFFLKLVNAFVLDPELKPSTFWMAMAGIMGLNSLYMLIRSMLGLAQFNSRSAPGLVGNMLGLGAMLGIGRMVMAFAGSKNGAENRLETVGGSTISQVQKAGQAGGTSAVSTIAGMFSNFKQPEYSAVGDVVKKGLRLGGSATGAAMLGLAGGMITAAAGQDPAGGLIIGAELGHRAGGNLGGGIGGIGSYARQINANDGVAGYIRNKAGFHDSSQYRDVQEMIQMGRNLTGGNFGAVAGEISGRFNRFRAKKLSPENSFRSKELTAIGSFKGEKAQVQDLVAQRKTEYEIEKSRMEAARANMAALEPDLHKRGRKPKELREAIKQYKEQKHAAAKAESLYKEILADSQEKNTLEYTLQTLAERSGRVGSHGFDGTYS